MVDNRLELDNVAVLEFLEERDLPNRRPRNSFLFVLEPDPFNSNGFICDRVDRLVNLSIGALSELCNPPVAVNRGC